MNDNVDELDLGEDDLDYTENLIDPEGSEDPNNLEDIKDPYDTGTAPEDHKDDFLYSILKDRGIDPDLIKIENEDGQIEEVKFSDLTNEEKLQLYKLSEEEKEDISLDDIELQFINSLRKEGLNPNAYLELYKEQILLEANQSDIKFKIDDMEDDELFLADLKSRISDLTDEEASLRLELAKSNTDLFNKEIKGIREEFKRLEQEEQEKEEFKKQQEEQEAFQAFESSIVTAIKDSETGIDLGELVLAWSDDDKNDVASLILDSDQAGNRYLARALNDPKTLVNMAWFALKGQEAISQISDYYKKKITEASTTNYNLGYEDAKNGNQRNSAKTVTRRQSLKSAPTVLTIDDI